MALMKEIQAKSGVMISYWKITDWKINQNGHSVDIILTPYISNKARNDGYEPLRDEIRKIRATDYVSSTVNRTDYTDYFSPEALERAAQEGKTIYNVMYDFIRYKDPDFKDAGNILN